CIAVNRYDPNTSFVSCICPGGKRSGHNVSPSFLPSGSLSSAYCLNLMTSHSLPLSSSIICIKRPAISSSCHRVITRTIAPPGANRVYSVDLYQLHTLSRIVLLLASSQFLNGSSIIARCAPRPVIGPPTPAAANPPRCFLIFQLG